MIEEEGWSDPKEVRHPGGARSSLPRAIRLELARSSAEVTRGGDGATSSISILFLAGLPSWITTPEGGLLKLVAQRTEQFLTSTSLERACLAAHVATENKGREVLVLDMRGITPLYDFFVLITGASRRQIHTIAEEIDDAMYEQGDRRLSIEGYEASKWVVQDYGDVVVHVFDESTRQYYALEELWADAPHVDWQRHY